jgi:hypothetical protein
VNAFFLLISSNETKRLLFSLSCVREPELQAERLSSKVFDGTLGKPQLSRSG